MRQRQANIATQRGVTLVELMVAMVISLIVLLGVATVYTSTKRSYNVQEELARMQENARYAIEVLGRDIRSAGYSGCNPKVNYILNIANTSDTPYDAQAGISGWEYTAAPTTPGSNYTLPTNFTTPSTNVADWTGTFKNPVNGTDVSSNLAAALNNNVLPGSDVLMTVSSDTLESLIPTGNTPANAAAITFNSATGIPANTIVIFSDCQKADIFQNRANANANSLTRPNSGTPGNQNPASVQFSHEFTDQARVSVVRSRAYFIGRGATGGPALFRADFSQGSAGVVPEELAEGIENMQILYGEDMTPGDSDIQPNRYVTANNITDPDNVISVRISLLVRTPQELNRQANARAFLLGSDAGTGVNVTNDTDRRFRKVFTATFFLRNKAVYRERN